MSRKTITLGALLTFPALAAASPLRSPELPEAPWTPSAYEVYLDAKRKEGNDPEAIRRIHPSRLEQMVAEPFGEGGMVLRLPRRLPLPTPAVSGPRVFLSGGYGSYEFYALDLKSLKPTWGVSMDAQGPARAVPAGDGVLLNTLGGLLLYVNQADGRRKWQRYTGELSTLVPAVDRGMVVTAYPFGAAQRLAAYRLSDGRPLFERQLDGPPITAPLIMGDSVWVTTYGGQIHRFLLNGGHRVFSRQIGAVSAPVAAEGRLFVTIRESSGKLALAVVNPADGAAASLFAASPGRFDFLNPNHQTGKPEAVKAVGFDLDAARYPASPGAMAGMSEHTMGMPGVASQWAYDGLAPVIKDGVAYISHHSGVSALSLATKKVLWHYGPEPTAEGGRFFSRPLVTATRVYVTTLGGEVMGLDRKTGAARFRWQSGYTLGAQPTYAGGRLVAVTATGEVFTLTLGS